MGVWLGVQPLRLLKVKTISYNKKALLSSILFCQLKLLNFMIS